LYYNWGSRKVSAAAYLAMVFWRTLKSYKALWRRIWNLVRSLILETQTLVYFQVCPWKISKINYA